MNPSKSMSLTHMLEQLCNEARGHLELTAEIVDAEHFELEAGEEFAVQFSIRNRFEGGPKAHPGNATFRNVMLWLQATPHAEPRPEPNVEVLVAEHLRPGQSATRVIRYRAKTRLTNVLFLELPDPLLEVQVDADCDVGWYFHVAREQGFVAHVDEAEPRNGAG